MRMNTMMTRAKTTRIRRTRTRITTTQEVQKVDDSEGEKKQDDNDEVDDDQEDALCVFFSGSFYFGSTVSLTFVFLQKRSFVNRATPTHILYCLI